MDPDLDLLSRMPPEELEALMRWLDSDDGPAPEVEEPPLEFCNFAMVVEQPRTYTNTYFNED